MFLVRQKSFWVLLVVIAAMAVRLAAVLILQVEPASDYANYMLMASSLLDTGHMSDGYGNVAFFSSGYPLFLTPFFAVFGAQPEVAQAINVVLGGLSVWLVFRCAEMLIPDWRWAVAAAAIWMTYPPSILYTEYVAKENLMIPLFLTQTLLLLQYLKRGNHISLAWKIGAIFALELLVGPAVIFSGGIIALVFIWASRNVGWKGLLQSFLVCAMAAIAVLSPWLIYTNTMLGQPVLNTNGPFNLYLGNNANNSTVFFKSIHTTPIGTDWFELRVVKGEVDALGELGRRAKQYIQENPGRTFVLALRKMLAFWYPPVHVSKNGEESRLESLVRKVWAGYYIAIIIFALVPLLFYRHLDRRYLVLYGTAVAYCIVHGIAYVIFRYRLPIMPFMSILAVAGIYLLYRYRFSASQ